MAMEKRETAADGTHGFFSRKSGEWSCPCIKMRCKGQEQTIEIKKIVFHILDGIKGHTAERIELKAILDK